MTDKMNFNEENLDGIHIEETEYDEDLSEVVTFNINETARLDSIVSEFLDITRSSAAKLIEEGNVTVSGKKASKSLKAKIGDEVRITLPPPKNCEAQPQNIPVEILYEDEELLVVNKPRGMVVHPAPGNYDGTLVNALLYHCAGRLSSINGVIRPGIVHRIDKDTSGLLMVAKADDAHV